MGRSQETFNKKEVRIKKEKKRKEKEEKKTLRKAEGKKKNFDDMIAYVDEFGKITSTPPDPNKREEVKAENIELDITIRNERKPEDYLRKGKVLTYNHSKGYGFIRDLNSGQSYFVHVKSLLENISENDIVIFEAGKGPKGPAALKVKLFREVLPA